jgi:hypothetical protein
MAQRTRVNWQDAMDDYERDATQTYDSIAAKHKASPRTLEWHAQKRRWREARAEYAYKVRTESVARCAADAATLLRERNELQLKQNDELREVLTHLVMARRPDGSIAVNGDLTLAEICKASDGLCALYRCDRLILGADDQPPAMPRDRFAEMSEEELEAELKRLKATELVSLSDEELEELGLKRAKPTLQ